MKSLSTQVSKTVRYIRRLCDFQPRVGLILGSGFGPAAEALETAHEFHYRDLPGFPVGKVPGHRGRLLLGTWNGVALAVLQGRAHYYEGFGMEEVTFPTRVLAGLGIHTLVATNAAGAINPRFRPGDFMVLSDHIHLMGVNPLKGMALPGMTPFVDLTQAYDVSLQRCLRSAARKVGARCHSGVYVAVSGPNYETPAEIRMFRKWGADAVGMSTVPEVLVARQYGLRVAGLSCLTNAAAGTSPGQSTVSHEEVLAMARQRQSAASQLLGHFLAAMGDMEPVRTRGTDSFNAPPPALPTSGRRR